MRLFVSIIYGPHKYSKPLAGDKTMTLPLWSFLSSTRTGIIDVSLSGQGGLLVCRRVWPCACVCMLVSIDTAMLAQMTCRLC